MLFDKLIEKRVAAFQNEILQKHYLEVENMYAKMRGWRHDYRHHIQTMKVHAKCCVCKAWTPPRCIFNQKRI